MNIKSVEVKKNGKTIPVEFRQDNGNNRAGFIVPSGVILKSGETLTIEIDGWSGELFDIDFVSNIREVDNG